MANERHFKVLWEGVEGWNQWREQSGETPDLSGANLSDDDFREANLTEADLSEADLSYADLSDTNLSDSDLSYANLSDSGLCDADLSGANLSDADLSDADLSRANLTNADLSGVDLTHADLSDVLGLHHGQLRATRGDLESTRLPSGLQPPQSWILLAGVRHWNQWRTQNGDLKPNLRDADLIGTVLSDANLTNADLTNANLINADLRRANLRNADLRHVDLTHADLSGVLGFEQHQLLATRGDLESTKLPSGLQPPQSWILHTSGVERWNEWRKQNEGIKPKLQGANLTNVDLSGVNLSGADLSEANLSEANLRDADLIGATLSDANLTAADLREADLSRADLFCANLRDVNLGGADLSYADLRNAHLHDAHLSEAHLTGAEVGGANLSEAELTDTVEVNLDLVYLGDAESAVKNSSLADHAWHRVFVGPVEDFSPDSYSEKSLFWLTRQGDESLLGRLHQLAAENLGIADDVTVEFSARVWRELHLVEIGLGEALGHDAVTFEKEADRLSVTFKNRDDVQRGIEYLLIQMSALETAEPERVERVTLRPPEGDAIVMERSDLEQHFGTMHDQLQQQLGSGLASIQNQLSGGSTPAEDAVVDSVGSLPVLGPLVKPFAKKTLERPSVRNLARMDVGEVWKRFVKGFRWIREGKEKKDGE